MSYNPYLSSEMSNHTKPELLSLENIKLSIKQAGFEKDILSELSLTLHKGEILALVGESGSGKSMTVKSIARLNESIPGFELKGNIRFGDSGTEILMLDQKSLGHFRNGSIGIIFQQSKNILNPSLKIGNQIGEKILIKEKLSHATLKSKVNSLLELVELQPASRYSESYPHQLSGGQLQRGLIALAMANNPDVLLADEPVSALDAHLKTEILQLILKLKNDHGLSVMLISHDLELVSQVSDRIAIIKDGRIVEQGTAQQVLNQPDSEYTRALLACRPSTDMKTRRLAVLEDFLDNPALTSDGFNKNNVLKSKELESRSTMLEESEIVISLENVSKSYSSKTSIFRQNVKDIIAINNKSLKLRSGEILGLVGPSGSGKSTLARMMAFIEFPDKGTIRFRNSNIQDWNEIELQRNQQKIQMVFQDPLSVMPPHITVGRYLNEIISNSENQDKIIAGILKKVGLGHTHIEKTPTMLSGGERQRVIIARSLLLDPEVLICDEILSALDVSVQAQVVNLLLELNRMDNLTILFISHDRNMVNFI
ncbi:MAG: ABC transporter ATP-binding protein, partial [Saprospiraceae bacterium]|nr:ABC transporter ATP-binding protein [Saprospiraceae bacterium]